MLCGCANPAERRAAPTSPHVDALRPRFDDARRLVVPSPPVSPLRRCFSVRVRPSPVTAAVAGDPGVEPTQSEESLGLGAEARARPPRNRSYTLTDGASSAIGRILTCFQDADASSDDAPRSRPRSRSLWSRRRSPASCLSANSPGMASGCVVDVVLDCSPGTVRRRRLETQSAASTSSTLHSEAAWNPAKATVQSSEASCELTATSSERLFHHPDEPVWERRPPQRGGSGRRRRTERPAGAQSQSVPAADIPSPRDCSNTSMTQRDRLRIAAISTPPRRRVVRRATTCAVHHPQVRVVQSTSSGAAGIGGGGRHPAKTDNENSIKVTAPCRVSC